MLFGKAALFEFVGFGGVCREGEARVVAGGGGGGGFSEEGSEVGARMAMQEAQGELGGD